MIDNFVTYDWSDKVILLVEDESLCLLYFQSALRDTEVKLLFAQNGEEAISMVNAHPEIDLILMDVQLPKLNGLEASRLIKQIRPNLHIIAQTAYTLDNDYQKALKAGCTDYVSKPIQIELLKDKIETIFMTN